ncbi:MAG TPA: hypothetical protein VHE55_16280 [Fimbriimonadaceae bacterium]|nr:hypothetical protein [Fimbriimonadaceae bacterium]
MKRIAPDVERLMWLIAEERDPRAIADFEARFPALRYELAKRISMVGDLRKSPKTPPHDIPRFVPRSGATMPQAVNRSIYVALAFVTAALAFGTYAAKSMLNQKPPTLPPVPPVNVSQPTTGNDEPLYTKPGPGKATVVPPVEDTHPTQPPQYADASDKNPLLHPIFFKNVRAPLDAALIQICKQAGLTYEMAPGMPQIEIEMNYDGEAAGDILADLGRRYNFTPYPQEAGSLLFIPVRPDETPRTDSTAPSDGTVHPGNQGAPPKDGGVRLQKRPDADGQ